MGTTIESDWENTRLLEELEAARAEIERLQAESDPEALHIAYLHGQADRNQKLAAEQAKNVELRELVEHFALIDLGRNLLPGDFGLWVLRARKAISTPDDLSSLRAHDEKLLATNTQAAKDVLAERERQKSIEGWTPEHDDQHRKGALAAAGGCYALFADYYLAEGHPPEFWPWDAKWWKPSLARRNLIKAGALIIAEIERLDRADAIEKGGDK